MNLEQDWSKIKYHFSKSFKTSLHVSIATISEDNIPTVTPIGSFFINNDHTGYYFEKYTKNININSAFNKNICVLGVNSSRRLWINALFKTKFETYPAIKIYGILQNKRPATEAELIRLKRRLRRSKSLPGHKYLWESMNVVRPISFYKAEKINLGKTTKHL